MVPASLCSNNFFNFYATGALRLITTIIALLIVLCGIWRNGCACHAIFYLRQGPLGTFPVQPRLFYTSIENCHSRKRRAKVLSKTSPKNCRFPFPEKLPIFESNSYLCCFWTLTVYLWAKSLYNMVSCLRWPVSRADTSFGTAIALYISQKTAYGFIFLHVCVARSNGKHIQFNGLR